MRLVGAFAVSSMTNEPILLRVAPHFKGCEFLCEIDEYRGIVEEALFDRLGRPFSMGLWTW